MTFLRTLFSTEPALVIGLVTAVLAVLVAFHLPITDVQAQAIVALVLAVLVLGGAFVTRQSITSPAHVAELAAAVPVPVPPAVPPPPAA